jgi:hypothetical protein
MDVLIASSAWRRAEQWKLADMKNVRNICQPSLEAT